jgi:uncharacterized protein
VPDHVEPNFEWDTAKSNYTLAQRGFDFYFASRVFESETYVEAFDDRHSDDEPRFVVVGVVDGVFITVIYTARISRKRILSARRSTRTERDEYAKAFGYEKSWTNRLE